MNLPDRNFHDISSVSEDPVSHLRCSEFLLAVFPTLTGWATFLCAYGALAVAPSIRDREAEARDW